MHAAASRPCRSRFAARARGHLPPRFLSRSGGRDIRARLTRAAAAALTLALPAIARDRTVDDEPVIELNVTSPPSGYTAAQSDTAARVNVPLQILPVTADSVPDRLLRDRGVQQISHALDTVAGVQRSPQGANGYSFIARGFSDANTTLLDGFREDGGLSDAQSVDRVDILKGPASALYGSGINSGGTVNVISKRATRDGFTRISLGGGSYGHARAALDANRDATGDGQLLVRLNVSLDRTGSFRRGNDSQTATFAPALTWTPTDRDTVTLLTRFIHSRYTFDAFQTPAVRAALDLKPSQSYVGPDFGHSRDDGARAALIYTHLFSDDLVYRLGVSASLTAQHFDTDNLGRFSVSADGATLSRTVLVGPQRILDWQMQNDISGSAQTGGIAHRWLVGLDVQHIDTRSKASATTLPPLNLATGQSAAGQRGPLTADQNSVIKADEISVYAQDFATWGRWHLLAGARVDGIYVRLRDRLAGAEADAPSGGISPRLGLSFDLDSVTTLYANTAAALIPNVGSRGFGGQALPPARSVQNEIGLRRQFLDGRLTANISAYILDKSDVAVPLLGNPTVSITAGGQRSRGIELELTGRLAPGWNIAASYAATSARQVSGTTIPAGNALPGVPAHALGLFTSYDFAETSDLSGWGGGIGVQAQTRREATLPNTFRLPGFVQIDVSIWRRVTLNGIPARVQIDATNIAAAKVYDTDGANFLRYSAARSVFAAIGVDF